MSFTTALRRLLSSATILTVSILALGSPAAQAATTTYPGSGTLHAWGYNGWGETQVPASLAGRNIVAMAGGLEATLALTSDGRVTAWGYNGAGETDVPSSLDDQQVVAVEAGNEVSYAITSTGRLVSWGLYAWVPPSLDDKVVTAVAAGDSSVALTSDGHVTMWSGDQEYPVPPAVAEATFTAVDTIAGTNFGVTSAGKVMSWDLYGPAPTPVPAMLDNQVVTEVAVSEAVAMALTADGRVFVWGYEPLFGSPDPDPSLWGQMNLPAELSEKGVVDIAAGWNHELALTSDGQVYGWGRSDGLADAPGDLGPATGIAAGYFTSLALTHDPLTVTGAPTITGTAQVGQTLTADESSVSSTPSSTGRGQWLRDGVAIANAVGTTYDLTNDDAGAMISYRTTRSSAGYPGVDVDSEGVGPVTGGHISLPTPVVTDSSPAVGEPLTVALPTSSGQVLTPADAEVSFTWWRGSTAVGTGETYTPTADDVGHTLTATATASRDGFDAATASLDTALVAPGSFSALSPPVVSGAVKVGQRLTATTGRVVPTPTDLTYQWYSDGRAVPDGTGPGLTLTPADEGATMTVRVTAIRPGYTPATAMSAKSAPVATDQAPDVVIGSGRTGLRRGGSTTLSWNVTNADTVVASGSWSGPQPTHGARSIRPTRLGAHTYRLAASNANGTTTAQLSINVTRQAKRLTVHAPSGLHLAGSRIRLTGRGLDGHEDYILKSGSLAVAAGKASEAGTFVRTFTIPSSTRQGRSKLTVVGSEPDRTGTTPARVVTKHGLRVHVARRHVRASDPQTVTVTGLASGEHVTVTYQGKRVSSRRAHATTAGRYRITFKVDTTWGDKTVRAVGGFAARRSDQTFTVIRRCTGTPTCA